MRGKGRIPSQASPHDRITPAYAGKRVLRIVAYLKEKDHPRMCGEKGRAQGIREALAGSPPHVRGKGYGSACALAARRDHPRVCGEKFGANTEKAVKEGSPPRMRGKVPGICKGLERVGITPACAGKRPSILVVLRHEGDHPRVCGEKTREVGKAGSLEGSPPRMRGKEGAVLVQLCKDGITPAHAGKRFLFVLCRGRGEDHPRTCGEKKLTFDAGQLIPGLPPHMRGKAIDAATAAFQKGITPAHAGKRCSGFRRPE